MKLDSDDADPTLKICDLKIQEWAHACNPSPQGS